MYLNVATDHLIDKDTHTNSTNEMMIKHLQMKDKQKQIINFHV